MRIVIACLVLAAAPPLLASQDDPVERFGRLPVCFNGRLATYDQYATWTLLNLGQGDTVFEPDGAPTSATRWIFDTLADHPDAWTLRCLHFPQQAVDIAFGHDRLGRGPYSPKALLDALTASADTEEAYWFSAVLEDYLRLMSSQSVEQLGGGFQAPRTPPPRSIPVADEHGHVRWFGALDVDAEHPTLVAWRALLEARRASPELLDARFATYESILAELDLTGPLAYALPEGWIPTGVHVAERPSFRPDIGGVGARAASFRIANSRCAAGIVFVPGATKTDREILDGWRLGLGLLPRGLSNDENDETLGVVDLNGAEHTTFDARTPRGQLRSERNLAAILRCAGGAWIVTCGGARLSVRRQAAAFERFVASIAIEGDAARARRWFGVAGTPALEPLPATGYALLPGASEQDELWVLRFLFDGSPTAVPDAARKLLEAIGTSPDRKQLDRRMRAGDFVVAPQSLGPRWNIMPASEDASGPILRGTLSLFPALDEAHYAELVRAIELSWGRRSDVAELDTLQVDGAAVRFLLLPPR